MSNVFLWSCQSSLDLRKTAFRESPALICKKEFLGGDFFKGRAYSEGGLFQTLAFS